LPLGYPVDKSFIRWGSVAFFLSQETLKGWEREIWVGPRWGNQTQRLSTAPLGKTWGKWEEGDGDEGGKEEGDGGVVGWVGRRDGGGQY
jgi:hypothetical protein